MHGTTLHGLRALLIAGLPVGAIGTVAALDILDIFRLRRVFTSLLVFGAGLPWELGHMLGAVVAFAAWTVVLGLLAVAAAAGLKLLPIGARAEDPVPRERGELLMALAIFGPSLLFLIMNYTLAMLAFAAVWLIPGVRLLRSVMRGLAYPARCWQAAAAVAVALWLCLAAGGVLLLERAALTAEVRLPLLGPGLGHLLVRLGLKSSAGRPASAVAFSEDSRVVFARVGGLTYAVEATSGRSRDDLTAAPPFSEKEKLTSPDGAVQIAMLADGGQVRFTGDGGSWTMAVHRPQKALALALARDGKLLATAGSDNVVRLWDLPSGRRRATLWGHSHDVVTVALSPDGRRVATASTDGTLRIWRRP